ncbi:MAG: radical SAM protein [Bacteroidota bacterium]
MDNRFNNIRCVIVKLTNRCNIRCEYCYENIVSKGVNMKSEVFQDMVETFLQSTNEKSVLFILHGGEPTILPENWFEENLQKSYELGEKYDKEVEFSIQTNLIKISETKLKIFKKYNVGIGGSIDNPDFLTESLRPLANKALNTYKKAKKLGIRVGILSTINSSNLDKMKDFCSWLHNSLNVNHFKANLAYSVGTGLELLVPDANSFFLAQKDVIKYMISNDGDFLEENLSQEIIRFIENYKGGKDRKSSLCGDKRCGAGSKVVGVTPQGNILPCGRFAWDDDKYFLGNLSDIDEEKENKFLKKLDTFHEANPENWKYCNDCEAKDICDFGCQGFIVRSIKKINIECLPTKLRFKYYQENINEIQKLYEKICAQKKRHAMTPFEQKLSKLKGMIPVEHHSLLKERLMEFIPN